MSDQSFHLTPIDIRQYTFGSAVRGYKKEDVETFREMVFAELDRLIRLNQDLDARAKGFHEQLRAFRERDKALNDALVSAQQLRGDMREQAEREAQLVLREAEGEAERILEAARAEIRRMTAEIESLERSRRAFLAHLRSVVERQLAEIDAASLVVPPQLLTPSAGEPEPAGPPPPPPRPSENGERRATHHPTPAWLDALVKE